MTLSRALIEKTHLIRLLRQVSSPHSTSSTIFKNMNTKLPLSSASPVSSQRRLSRRRRLRRCCRPLMFALHQRVHQPRKLRMNRWKLRG